VPPFDLIVELTGDEGLVAKVLAAKTSWVEVRLLGTSSSRSLTIAVDPLSDEALIHLKSYKYSSVDKSWVSNHILRHYVHPTIPAVREEKLIPG
jgi:hypothetical protein